MWIWIEWDRVLSQEHIMKEICDYVCLLSISNGSKWKNIYVSCVCVCIMTDITCVPFNTDQKRLSILFSFILRRSFQLKVRTKREKMNQGWAEKRGSNVDEQQSNRQSREITTETISRPLILLYLNVPLKWRDTIVFHSLNRTEAAF